MMKKNVLLLFIFGLFGLFMRLLLVYWYGWLLVFCCMSALLWLRRGVYWKGSKIFFYWAFALTISFSSLIFLRPERNVSFPSVLVRESIRFLLKLPILQDEGFIALGAKYALIPFKWNAPPGYIQEQYDIDGLPIEFLHSKNTPSQQIILQFHGGAYIIPLINLYRNNAVRYSKISNGLSVATIDYRVAPENPYPAALEDAQKAWDFIIAKGYNEEDIILVGDSCGGNLALALTLKLRDEGKKLPKALICMSAWTDMTKSGISHQTNIDKDPLFSNSGLSISLCYANGASLYNPYISPAYGDFDSFPPMLLQVGTHEILQSDSIIVYEKASLKDVDITLTQYEGMFHVFQLLAANTKEGKLAWQEVKNFIQYHLQHEKGYYPLLQ
jgi:acetyl esterase/lipase